MGCHSTPKSPGQNRSDRPGFGGQVQESSRWRQESLDDLGNRRAKRWRQ